MGLEFVITSPPQLLSMHDTLVGLIAASALVSSIVFLFGFSVRGMAEHEPGLADLGIFDGGIGAVPLILNLR